jgi:hypothetical protein
MKVYSNNLKNPEFSKIGFNKFLNFKLFLKLEKRKN